MSSSFAQSDLDVYVNNMVQLLNDAKYEYLNDNVEDAKRFAMIAYIDNYEYLEDPIDAYDEELKDNIEITLREELQQMMRDGESPIVVNQLIDQILKKLKTATEIVPELSAIELTDDVSIQSVSETQDNSYNNGGGCLIATATYGSELSAQVQQLRELRDNKLLQTPSGNKFMNTFNEFYYSFSPIIADAERENPMFREAVRVFITPMISTLSIMMLADNDSEIEILGLGISVITLNLGMYIAAPVFVGLKISKYFKSRKS